MGRRLFDRVPQVERWQVELGRWSGRRPPTPTGHEGGWHGLPGRVGPEAVGLPGRHAGPEQVDREVGRRVERGPELVVEVDLDPVVAEQIDDVVEVARLGTGEAMLGEAGRQIGAVTWSPSTRNRHPLSVG